MKSKETERKKKEELAQKIYDELEEQLYISSFKPEKEIIEKILELDCDRDRVQQWLDEFI